MRDIGLIVVSFVAALLIPPLIGLIRARQRSRVLKVRQCRQVVVTLQAGATFEGVLFDFDRDALVLRNVTHLVQGADRPVPVDGELVVLAADVLFVQFP